MAPLPERFSAFSWETRAVKATGAIRARLPSSATSCAARLSRTAVGFMSPPRQCPGAHTSFSTRRPACSHASIGTS
eukprot:14827460-Heterocapsa_arctica.AAC.1